MTGHGNGVLAGQSLTLECEVSGAEMLGNFSITYNWTRGNSTQDLSTNMQYTFSPTAGDADVMYHCSATLMGGLLTSPITTNTTSQTIRVFGESELVYLYPSKKLQGGGQNFQGGGGVGL